MRLLKPLESTIVMLRPIYMCDADAKRNGRFFHLETPFVRGRLRAYALAPTRHKKNCLIVVR